MGIGRREAGAEPVLLMPLYDATYALRLARDRDRCVRNAERVYFVAARASLEPRVFRGSESRRLAESRCARESGCRERASVTRALV